MATFIQREHLLRSLRLHTNRYVVRVYLYQNRTLPYEKMALKTHPDKNPENANATAQFQQLSEAYNVLLKHLDRSSPPTRNQYPGFGSESDYDDDDDDYYFGSDDDDYYDDDEMDFYRCVLCSVLPHYLTLCYRFLFEELLRSRSSRFTQHRASCALAIIH